MAILPVGTFQASAPRFANAARPPGIGGNLTRGNIPVPANFNPVAGSNLGNYQTSASPFQLGALARYIQMLRFQQQHRQLQQFQAVLQHQRAASQNPTGTPIQFRPIQPTSPFVTGLSPYGNDTYTSV